MRRGLNANSCKINFWKSVAVVDLMMNKQNKRLCQKSIHHGRCGGAFTLLEIAVSVALFAFVLVGVIGLVPAGLKTLKESDDDTRVALILQDVEARLTRLSSRPSEFRDPATFSRSVLFDRSGVALASATDGEEPVVPAGLGSLTPYYEVKVTLHDLDAYPPRVSRKQMLAARIQITWPHGSNEPHSSTHGMMIPMMADEAWPSN